MPNGKDDPQTLTWHVDRRVPLALIYTIVGTLTLQAGGLVIWGTSISNRIDAVEKEIAARAPIVDRFIGIEARVNAQSIALDGRLNRIEDKLDRLIETGFPRRGQIGGQP